jgi:serine/threonine protein kinase
MESGVLLADRYRLVRRLGEGGLATALQVRDEALERDVCLKLLREGADEAALVREFDALVGLVHPSLARVHDYGVAVVAAAHRPFVTMDLVEGTPLAVFAEGRRFDEVRGAIVDVAHALAFLHASGLRHGDVKPDNVVVKQARGRSCSICRARGASAKPVTSSPAPWVTSHRR